MVIRVKTWQRMVELIKTMPHPVGTVTIELQENGAAILIAEVRGRPDGNVIHTLTIDKHLIVRVRYDDIIEALFRAGLRVQQTTQGEAK